MTSLSSKTFYNYVENRQTRDKCFKIKHEVSGQISTFKCSILHFAERYYRRNHENLTVHPISEQHIQHLPAINRLHLRRNRCDEIHVSVIPYSRDFIPPPAYQEITRGEQGVQDLPPSYDSLYPGRAPN